MWIEAKGVCTVLACIMIALVMVLGPGIDFILVIFLLIMALFGMIFGDILLYIQIRKTRADLWFEPVKGNEELGVLETLTGLLDLVRTVKGPEGKREFVYHGEEASVINNGKGNFHLRSGTPGFFIHEGYDQNVDPVDAKAMNEFKGDNIKEIYQNVIDKRPEEKKPNPIGGGPPG